MREKGDVVGREKEGGERIKFLLGGGGSGGVEHSISERKIVRGYRAQYFREEDRTGGTEHII